MAKIKIYNKGTSIIEKDLDTANEYVFGRGSQCDFVLDNPEVSRQHAKLKYDGQQWQVSVLSRFGRIVVHGSQVESVSLAHGSSFHISPFEIRFEETASANDTVAVSSSPAVVAEPSDLSEQTNVAEVELKSVLLRMNESEEPVEEITLGKGLIDGGRSRSCPIQIKDEQASRKHFQIVLRGNQFTINHLGGTLPTLVNGQAIQSYVLQTGDLISVGTDKFRFELVNPEFENLPALINHNDEKTEAHVLKITPDQAPALWQQKDAAGKKSPLNPRVLAMLAIIVGGAFYALNNNKPAEIKAPRTPAGQIAASTQSVPYDRLPASQKKFVDDTYNLASRSDPS
jgi:pSer/pThr/pTyr-binding forkhead associated (FHA) protein